MTKDYSKITNGFNKVLGNKDERLLYTSATLCEIAKVNTDSYESYSNNFNEVFGGTEIKRSNLNQQNFIDDEISVCKSSAATALGRKNNLSGRDLSCNSKFGFMDFVESSYLRQKRFDELIERKEQQRLEERRRKEEEEAYRIAEEHYRVAEEEIKRKSRENSKIVGTVLKKYDGNAEEVIIPDGVMRISKGAFSDCVNLKRVVIPKSVTRIDRGAFRGCNNLTSINLPFVGGGKDEAVNTHFGYIFGAESSGDNSQFVPASLKTVTVTGGSYIDDCAFWHCGKLTHVTLADSIRSIGFGAFSDCGSLTRVTLPSGITTISGYTFWHCSSLTSVNIPDSVTGIYGYAFSGCSSLTNIVLPHNLTSFGAGAFKDCGSLTSIIIPNGVSGISNGLFSCCGSLKSVELPHSVTSIVGSAFSGCSSLKTIVIPNSVLSIGACAFDGCGNLVIYCESDSQPHGWHTLWNKYNSSLGKEYRCHVVWGYGK